MTQATPNRRATPSRASEGGFEIAVVGAACRLPGARDPDGFAELLFAGRDAVSEIPPSRFSRERFLHPRPGEPGRALHFRAGVIEDDPLRLDHAGFGVSPREAAEMDPQQRLLLQLAREALRDAGWPEASVAGRRIGAFVGASTTDWSDMRQHDPSGGDRYMMTGGALSILANRLTNAFDLRGPGLVVDTACSSGLVALDAACRALASGEAEAALVGGVNLLLSPLPFVGFWRAGMLSKRGRCQAFGAGADGYVRAEGGVVLALKPLAAARRDGDAVRGVVLATGVNSAGRTNGLSLPDQAAQARLIAEVLARAGVAPDELGAFEAHGTGTPAGDPIEAAAIAQAAARPRRRGAGPLPLGSAKSNIGHTEAAAGLVGVLKALAMLERGRIAPTLHCDLPNPAIPFAEHNLALATAARPLRGRAVAVNSFGFGGTNGCAVLARAPAAAAAAPRARPAAAAPPLLLSARSPAALREEAAGWRELLARTPSAAARAALLRGQARRRDLLRERLVLRGDRPGLEAALDRFLAGEELPGRGTAPLGEGVAFVFSGNGAQWAGMAREELRLSPAFRRGLEEAEEALAPRLGRSPLRLLRRGVTAPELAGTDLAQPLLFAVQWGVVAALSEHGIRPALALGHSVGEVAAAACAGLLSLEQAARLIVARSARQHETRGAGRMAALGGAAAAEAAELLDRCSAPGEAPLEIAAVNGPASLTAAGPADALERLGEAAAALRLSFVPLDLDYAFHSAAMEPVREGLLADLRRLRAPRGAAAPRVPMISSVTGKELGPADMTAAYWWRNLRAPVRFDLALRGAAERRPALFLEIGPSPVLQGYLRSNLREARLDAAVLPTLLRRQEEGAAPARDPFPGIADRAAALGADPRGAACFDGPARWRGLPAAEPQAGDGPPPARSAEAVRQLDPPRDHRLLGFRTVAFAGDAPEEWTRSLDAAEEPWLADHRLFGEAVMPATAMLEMALAAGFLRHPDAPAMEAAEAVIFRPLPVAEDAPRQLRSRLGADGRFTLESRRRLSEEGWTLHCEARVAAIPALPPLPPPPPAPGGEARSGAAVTEAAARLGLGYGPAFQSVVALRADPAAGRALAELAAPPAAPPDDNFHLHPSRADGALQALLGLLGEEGRPGEGFVPVRFGRLALRRGAAPPVAAELALEALGERSVEARATLRDALGAPVALLERATLQRLRRPSSPEATGPESLLFRTDWVPAPPPPGWPEPAPALPVAALDLAEMAAPPPARLAEAGLLAEAALAAFAAEALRRTAPPPPPGAGEDSPLAARLRGLAGEGELPEAGAIWRQAWAEAPELAPELAAIARAGGAMPRALAGERLAPVPAPRAGAPARLLAARLAAAAARLARSWPAARPFRVLVAGAEEGPLLPALHDALARALGPALRLVAAPLPEDRAPATPAGVEIRPWDPLGEEAPPSGAELVVALSLTPRRPFGPALVEGLRRALAPGGALLLAEPEPGPFWDATQGLDPAWWEGGGAAPRLAPAAAWAERLAAAGLQGVRAASLPGAPWSAALLAASAPAGAQLLSAAPARRFALFAAPGAEALVRALAEALGAAGAQSALRPLRAAGPPAPRELLGTTVVALPRDEADHAPLARLAAAAEAAGARLALAAEEGGGPGASGALALGRVLANEMPALRPLRFGLEPRLDPGRAARLLAAALLAPEEAEAEQILLRAGRLVPRLAPGLPEAPPPPGPRRLAIGRPGQLATLRWEAAPPLPAPGPGEVAVRIAACGLNFRDVMWAQGLLPEEALRPGFAGPRLGLEFAGTVEAAGEGVAAELAPGRRVFGIAPGALATRALTRAEAVAPLPDHLSFEEGATLPVAFLTALHALEGCARVEPGERVLIHGGAGALGLAALQVALAAGARVAVTAGSEERRALLRQAGAELAFDSRDTRFADALRAAWGEVDVALNSLSGEAMERTLGLMAPFGRFVELGKRDFAENTRVALRPLRRNVSYFAVDLDEVAKARPALAGRMLRDLGARLAAGAARPLPRETHPAGQAEAAFRALQGGGHIGKRVILPPPEGAAPARPWLPDGPVVVVGGAGGFGLEAACWLVERGVRRLALLSRRGPAAPGAEAALARLAALGAEEARHLAADAAEPEALGAALAGLRAAWGPLGGVVHAAAVYADGTAARLSEGEARTVWRAKVGVAEALDAATRGDPLSLFLLFSSATVPVGSPGQAAYVAANAGLEAIARRRHAEGRPALAVQWGPVADAGILARAPADAAALARRLGAEALPARALLDALPALLASGLPVAGAARVAWRGARAALPLLAEPAFAEIAGGGVGGGGAAEGEAGEADLRARLAAAAPEEALALLREAVAREVGRILRLPPGAIPPDAPLARLGLDSLGGIELRTGLERRFALDIPLAAVNDALTVDALSRRLRDGLRAARPEAAE